MNVILIYQQIPEELELYFFQEPDLATLMLLRRCHRQYVNTTDCTDQEVINFLCTLPAGKRIYADTGTVDEIPRLAGTTEIIVAGIIL